MANLAIKGHPTRGSEVIALLEMLGGNNANNCYGEYYNRVYYINENGYIDQDFIPHIEQNTKFIIFTLKEFLEKYAYKVGDKVTHNMGILMNVVHICWDAECNVIRYDIQSPVDNNYKLKAMLAEHIQPYKEETMKTITIDDFKANTKEWLIEKLHGMIISDAIKTIGNIHDELHKPKYPKTFIEVLNFWHPDRQLEDDYQRCYKKDLIEKFQDLLYARDAYWKIAGEEMGLGKPWEPDMDNENEYKYGLFRLRNIIYKDATCINPTLLIFPTLEMRDAFYENFKELIENVKELL